MKQFTMATLALMVFTVSAYSQETPPPAAENPAAQQQINRNWSLFSEYHKNKDYISSIKYGMWLAKNAPEAKRTLWQRLQESFVNVYLDSTLAPEARAPYLDSSMIVLDLGRFYTPDKAQSFWLRKGFNFETYYKNADSAIANYQSGIAMNPAEVDVAYAVMCGRLMIQKEMVQETIDLYSSLIDAYEAAGKPEPAQTLRYELSAIANPEQLIEVYKKALEGEKDPEKRKKLFLSLYKLYADSMKEDEKAIEYINQLIAVDPSATNYRLQGKTLYSLGKYNEAIGSYQKALKAEETKEDLLNIAQAYVNLEKGSQARDYARRALKIDKNLGRAYILIGQAYEAAVADCVGKKGGWTKIEFSDKVVYLAIEEAYLNAARVDESVAGEAKNRIQANKRSNLYPTKEDYFLRQQKAGDVININSGCYAWIGETVTVPKL
ncbi:MAG: hypothetical protein HUU10_03160 [Bacteroidetes bacterium]|nr:hypothetical protein [Bacteroidota bacterium]